MDACTSPKPWNTADACTPGCNGWGSVTDPVRTNMPLASPIPRRVRLLTSHVKTSSGSRRQRPAYAATDGPSSRRSVIAAASKSSPRHSVISGPMTAPPLLPLSAISESGSGTVEYRDCVRSKAVWETTASASSPSHTAHCVAARPPSGRTQTPSQGLRRGSPRVEARPDWCRREVRGLVHRDS